MNINEQVIQQIVSLFKPCAEKNVEVNEQGYFLAQKHDLTHLLAVARKRNGGLGTDELSVKLKKSIYRAVVRHEQLVAEQNRICTLFEQEKIVYLPLKGAVLRDLYPEPWYRTSCDIDILIHEEDISKAISILEERLDYKVRTRNYHDVSLLSPNGVHFELHFSICENKENIDSLLSRVWDYAHRVDDTMRFEMESSFLVFHIVAHSYHHLLRGGCGIRPIIDLWLLSQQECFDYNISYNLCKTCGVERLYEQLLLLGQVWFSEKEHTTVTRALEEYILQGGAYGSQENKVAVDRRKKGKAGYVFSRLFPSNKALAKAFDKEQIPRILYPCYIVRKWLKLCSFRTYRKNRGDLSINYSISDERISNVDELFSNLGIKKGC